MKERSSSSREKWVYDILADRIRQARKDGDLTQAQLAIGAGLNRTSIAKIEAGDQSFTVDKLYAIAKTLKVDVVSLLPKISEQPKKQVNEKKILEAATLSEPLEIQEKESILRAISAGLGHE